MTTSDHATRLDELRIALRMDTADGRQRLERLRRECLRIGETDVAALALWGIAQKEFDLGRKGALHRKVVQEYPQFLAYRALADTEIGLNRLNEAREACREALRLSETGEARRAVRHDLREIDRAVAGDAPALARLRNRRVQQETDLAMARSRFEPKAASARLWRMRRKALAAGDRIAASLLLGGLIDVAQQCAEPRRALRLARTLVAETREVWTLVRLGEAQRCAGMRGAAKESYSMAAALAKQQRDRAQLKTIREKQRLLDSHA